MGNINKIFTCKDIVYFILVFLVSLAGSHFLYNSVKLDNTIFYTYSTIVQTLGALVGVVILFLITKYQYLRESKNKLLDELRNTIRKYGHATGDLELITNKELIKRGEEKLNSLKEEIKKTKEELEKKDSNKRWLNDKILMLEQQIVGYNEVINPIKDSNNKIEGLISLFQENIAPLIFLIIIGVLILATIPTQFNIPIRYKTIIFSFPATILYSYVIYVLSYLFKFAEGVKKFLIDSIKEE